MHLVEDALVTKSTVPLLLSKLMFFVVVFVIVIIAVHCKRCCCHHCHCRCRHCFCCCCCHCCCHHRHPCFCQKGFKAFIVVLEKGHISWFLFFIVAMPRIKNFYASTNKEISYPLKKWTELLNKKPHLKLLLLTSCPNGILMSSEILLIQIIVSSVTYKIPDI